MEPFWTSINEPLLRQGDLLPGCSIPEFPPDFDLDASTTLLVQVDRADLIVIAQSCDLAHGGLSLVAMCPVWSGRQRGWHATEWAVEAMLARRPRAFG